MDLSVPVGRLGTVVYPGDPAPRFEVHSTIEREGFNLLGDPPGQSSRAPTWTRRTTSSRDGLRVDEIPPERFVGPGGGRRRLPGSVPVG